MLALIIVLLVLSLFMVAYYVSTNKKEGIIFRLEHWQTIGILLVVYDLIAVNLSYFIALWLRFDLRYSSIPITYRNAWLHFAPYYTIFCMIVFLALRLYQSIWRFISFNELIRVLASSCITGIFHSLIITLCFHQMPISYYIIGTLIQFLGILSVRFSYRLVLLLKKHNSEGKDRSRVMIIGAGEAGQMLIRDMKKAPEIIDIPVCIIDDNSNKWNRFIDGVLW